MIRAMYLVSGGKLAIFYAQSRLKGFFSSLLSYDAIGEALPIYFYALALIRRRAGPS